MRPLNDVRAVARSSRVVPNETDRERLVMLSCERCRPKKLGTAGRFSSAVAYEAVRDESDVLNDIDRVRYVDEY